MSSRQYEFIRQYNEVHEILKEKLDNYIEGSGKNHVSFHDLISILGQSKPKRELPFLASFRTKLDLINNFRNTIIHRQTEEFYNIAEPSDLTMDILGEIIDSIVKPISVRQYFKENKRPKIVSVKPTDTLTDVMNKINSTGFSQFPVFDGQKLVGIITENGLTHFIASQVGAGKIDLETHDVAEVLEEFDANAQAFIILNENVPLYEVLNKMYYNIDKKESRYVLISKSNNTQHIKRDEMTGLFTNYDIPKLVQTLDSYNGAEKQSIEEGREQT